MESHVLGTAKPPGTVRALLSRIGSSMESLLFGQAPAAPAAAPPTPRQAAEPPRTESGTAGDESDWVVLEE